MAVIVSQVVFTKVDQTGNPWVEGWFTLEFRAASYQPGGEFVDFSSFYKQVIYAQATPLSGQIAYDVRANQTDFPNTTLPANSSRFQLDGLASTIVALNISGIGIQIASGTQIFISGALLSGQVSGVPLSVLFSGRLAATASGDVAALGAFRTEVLSGTAVSGVRFMAHVLGY